MKNLLNILIVDDDNTNIQTVGELLENKFNILVATSGSQALQILDKTTPHIIILDISMPQMDGFELTKKIYENQKNKNIHIIFLSANDTIEYLEKGFNLGASDYITKPIEPKKFLLKIEFWAKFIHQMIENKKDSKLLEQYKSAIDKSTIVSKSDKQGVITYVNDKFCEVSGYTKEELLGKPHNIVRHKDVPQEVFKELWNTIKVKKQTWMGKIKNRKKDGSAYYVDTIVNPIVDENNEIIEFIAIRTDITLQEEEKEQLKEKYSIQSGELNEVLSLSKSYEEALNTSSIIIRVNTNRIITFVNDTLCDILGYKKDELIGKPYKMLKHPETSQEQIEAMFDYVDKGKLWKGNIKNLSKDKKTVHFISSVSAIRNSKNEIIEYMGVRLDITEIINLKNDIQAIQKEVVFTMGAIGETRSKETGLHVKRVAEYSYLLAKLAGMSEEKANLLKQASPMHDIGKVGIPDNVLNKAGKLTEEEFEIMKNHAALGYEMLKYSQRDILKTAATVAYTHHEKWDGSGYPNKIKGENIPIEGRITAIVDVFDALGHDRVYKKAWPLEHILELFKKEKGKHFDPNLIDLFFENLEKFLEIQKEFND